MHTWERQREGPLAPLFMFHQYGVTRTIGALASFKFTSPGWLKSLLVQRSEDLSPVCFGVQPLPRCV